MSHDAFDWFAHIRAAAAHSPQALDFAHKALVRARREGGRTAECEAMDYALGAFDVIVNQRLPYYICIHEGVGQTEKLVDTVAALGRLCPNWRIRPGWHRMDHDKYIERSKDDWGPRLVGPDGKIVPEVLFARLDKIETLGGVPYRSLLAFVNKSAAAHVKMFYEYATIEDYSDLMENGLRCREMA